MKLNKISAIFLTISLLTSSFSTNVLLQNLQTSKLLHKSICNIANDILKSSNNIQDVMIGNFESKSYPSIINAIMQCINVDDPVVVSDFKKPIIEENLRKAAVVILVFGSAVDKDTIRSIVLKHHFGTVWHHMTKVICVVPSSIAMNARREILIRFADYGFLDVTLVHTTKSGDFLFESLASLKRKVYTEINPTNSSILFRDKLKNMEGYAYRVVMYEQDPRLQIVNNQIFTPLLHFLNILCKAQNANVRVVFFRDQFRFFHEHWMSRMIDLTVNTAIIIDTPEPKLLSYEEDASCVLVPLPAKNRISQLIFIESFDSLTWLFLLLTMSACVVVWWMFRGRGAVDSPWLVAYGMFVMLIGQGVDFSPKNRMVLVILLQLIIVMMFVLNNAYDGVITSFMITPIHEHRLKTFDEIIASDFDIMAGEGFLFKFKDSNEYMTLKPRITIRIPNASDNFRDIVKNTQLVLIVSCETIEYSFQGYPFNGIYLQDHYYLLPQKLFSTYVRLEASYLNPFLERIQYYMDLCFQAGLMQIWKTMDGLNNYVKVEELDEVEYLYLRDLSQVFGVLIIGYALSTVLMFIEIFFCDFFNNLKFAHLGQRLRNKVHNMAYKKRNQPKDIEYQRGALYYIIHRHQKLKRLKPRRLKVREIFVTPRNSEE